jgi:hypothetical protein
MAEGRVATFHHGFEAGQLLKVVHQRLQAVDALLLHKAQHCPPQATSGAAATMGRRSIAQIGARMASRYCMISTSPSVRCTCSAGKPPVWRLAV